MKYKLIIAYDGTPFCGWQNQPNGTSIQSVIEEKLKVITKQEISITAAGRTDAGVHALGQVAHFSSDIPLDPFKLKASLNGLLPEEICIKEIETVSDDFHARFSALNKEYHYHINLSPSSDPFLRNYSWHISDKINLELLQIASQYLIGTHNFSSFANEQDSGSAGKNPVRTIKRISIVEQREGIRLEFEADSFLYKMVRNLTGTLMDVGRGKLPLEELPLILEAKDRKRGGRAAPAKGLFLVRVDYSSP